MIGLAARLQTYLREKAQYDGRERVRVPPFTLFFDPTVNDAKEGIAIPDEAQSYSAEDVSRLCAAFIERGRVPCLQYLDTFAPSLTITLQLGHSLTPPPNFLPIYGEGEKAANQIGSMPLFNETLRLPVMYCTTATLVYPPEVPGLEVKMALSESPLDEVKDGWNVNARGFDKDMTPATDAIADAFRQTLLTSRGFVAYLADEPVAAGLFTEIQDGITELVGITTLPEYRRQGIGAALTANMTRAAFDSGVVEAASDESQVQLEMPNVPHPAKRSMSRRVACDQLCTTNPFTALVICVEFSAVD